MTPWTLIGWAVAIVMAAFLLSYAGAIVYAAIKSFIIIPREKYRFREHSRRMLEIEGLNAALKGNTGDASRILWKLLEKAGGEITIEWQDLLSDAGTITIYRREKDSRSVTFSTRP